MKLVSRLLIILMLLSLSLVVIYSAGAESTALLTRQSIRMGFALVLLLGQHIFIGGDTGLALGMAALR